MRAQAPNIKSPTRRVQITKHKSQTILKTQLPNPKMDADHRALPVCRQRSLRHAIAHWSLTFEVLRFGAWDLFVIWDL
jgi:hypothetical protein